MINLATLTDSEFSRVSNVWARGIDFLVCKAPVRGWVLPGEYGPVRFKTKSAAYDAATAAVLAESRRRREVAP